MAIRTKKITTTTVIKGTAPENTLPVWSKSFNDLVDDVEDLYDQITSGTGDVVTDDLTVNDDATITGDLTVTGVATFNGTADLNGTRLILDADADTSITADTDDQIDVEIAGADDFTFTANTFTALSGSTIATNTIAETTAASGVTIDGVLVKDSSIALADGLVSNLALKLGADANNGIYGISDTQMGFAVEGVLVGGANTTGLFADVISEQTSTVGVTIDSVLLKDGGVSNSGVTQIAGFFPTVAAQALSGPGAVNVTAYLTKFTSTGAGDALTIASGTQIGQRKKVQHVVDGGSGVLTGVFVGGTTITFTAVAEFADLLWTGSAWAVLELGNTAAPGTPPVLA